jgi:aspartate-semialdehyde dehydrogenase
VNVEFEKDFSLDDVRNILSATKGIVVIDEPSKQKYPMPIDAEGKDEVFVGRLRRDESQERTLNMWIVSDNLRKGAATNAVQIAEYMMEKKLI